MTDTSVQCGREERVGMWSRTSTKMSAEAIENGEGFAADALLQESQSDEEEETSQPSSAGSTPGGPPQGPPSEPDGPGSDSTDLPTHGREKFFRHAKMAALAVTGGVVAVGAVPVVLSAMGFTGAGIAASSLAAKMMSAAAIANGGGVAAGSLVATLQSVGAAGLSLSSKALLGFAGSSFGAWMGRSKEADPSFPPAGPSGGDSQDGNPPTDKPPASQNCSEKGEK